MERKIFIRSAPSKNSEESAIKDILREEKELPLEKLNEFINKNEGKLKRVYTGLPWL